jgi:hypothetical protein
VRAPQLDLVPGVTDDPHIADCTAFGALVIQLRRGIYPALRAHPGDERALLR